METESMTTAYRAIVKTLALSLGLWGGGFLFIEIVLVGLAGFGACYRDPRPNGPERCHAELHEIHTAWWLLTAVACVPVALWFYRAFTKKSSSPNGS